MGKKLNILEGIEENVLTFLSNYSDSTMECYFLDPLNEIGSYVSMIRIGTCLRIGCAAYALQHPQISVVYKPAAAAASRFCHNPNFSTRSIRKDAGRKISASHDSRTPETQQKEAGGEADRRAHHVLAEASTLEVPLRL